MITMDLFLRLSDSTKRLLHLTGDAFALIEQLTNQNNDETMLQTIQKIEKAELSAVWAHNLHDRIVNYVDINNPFYRWNRLGRIFEKGNFRRTIPPESDLNPVYTSKTVAYATYGYEDSGSNAIVKTLVAYNGRLSIIKRSADIDKIFYEIITQAYLFEQLSKKIDNAYKYICVPEIFFVQRARENNVDICMHRAVGKDLNHLTDTPLMIALAHVCKSLWHLQRDFHFMHRDLSGTNVFYDDRSKKVTFIDFGYSCVNPRPVRDQAWQSGDESFYDQTDNNHASMCTNMSLDICILIAVLSDGHHPWCREEHQRMKRVMKATVDASTNEAAKSKFKHSQSYTVYGENWYFSNQGAHHWWLYNMVEFPLEEWYPATVLTRLLYHIPLRDWFALRKNWTMRFDNEMPKNIRIKINANAPDIPNVPVFKGGQVMHVTMKIANKTGTLLKLFSTNQLQIKLDDTPTEVQVLLRLCERIF